MASSEAEGSLPPAMALVIDELTKGRQSVATLATLLFVDPLELQTAKLLLEETMSTISKAIAILECVNSQQDHTAVQLESPSSAVTSKGPVGKRKIQSTRKAASRKRGNPYSWKRVTSATIEDGHTWRKYGQKEIFSAKHPRSYFRCTYKYDQGCKATRQVQKSEEDPFLYVITYFGEHTCEAAKENNPRCREPCVVSFESNKINEIKQEIAFSSFPSHKQENEEEVVSNLTSVDSRSNCLEQPAMELHKSSITGLEPGWSDSSSGLNFSINSYDVEFMDLEDILSFELNEFFAW
ncbi:WRKY DNA-binding transcription factor 70 [Dendrobium catenatum]|uniref:WRKY DNA-binding transcription factor 70 n=1 Tax=Dendrobium catenatum TaxID=906689 RepID=UPI0009F3126E|nr:WRKY DNA-binding transcription factor 70 [Dendrobium catenatum]